MARSNAERQQAYRDRAADRAADADAEIARLRAALEDAHRQLAAALAEVDRLTGNLCKHPAGAVVDGVCQLCGAECW
jgi:hypothetical protein